MTNGRAYSRGIRVAMRWACAAIAERRPQPSAIASLHRDAEPRLHSVSPAENGLPCAATVDTTCHDVPTVARATGKAARNARRAEMLEKAEVRSARSMPTSSTLPRPRAAALPGFDIAGPERFINRELSWLAFNWRVMSEAENPAVPLLERVRFLSISASNLDEFYSVRVAGLRGLVREGVHIPSADGLSAGDQLRLIDADARALMMRQQECLGVLRQLMRDEGIEILGAGRPQGRRPQADGGAFLRPGLPDPVAARHRPGASLPVHRQRRLRHGPPAQARGRRHRARGAAAGAGAGPALRAAAGGPEGADPLPAARGAARGVPRQALPRLRHARALRLPRAARQRPRGGGGGRGPGARVRDRAEAAAAGRGDPAHHDRRRARRPPAR